MQFTMVHYQMTFINQLFKPCGVDYQLKTHLAESLDDKPEKL